jgi:hypothetical protein
MRTAHATKPLDHKAVPQSHIGIACHFDKWQLPDQVPEN